MSGADEYGGRDGVRSIVLLIWAVLSLASLWFLQFYFVTPHGRVPWPLGQYVYFAANLCVALILSCCFRGKLGEAPTQYWFSLAGLAIACVAAAVHGVAPLLGLRLAAILALTCIPFILFGSIMSIGEVRAAVLGVFLICLLPAVGAWALQFWGPIRIGNVTLTNHLHAGSRWSFLFAEANTFGAVVVAGAVSSISAAFLSRKLMMRLVIAVGVWPFMVYVYMQSESRGALLWLMWGVAVYAAAAVAWIRRQSPSVRRRARWGAVVVVVFGALVVSAFYGKIFQGLLGFLLPDRVNKAALGIDGFTSLRWHVWLEILQQIKSHPLLGYGFGGTGTLLAGQYPPSPLNVFLGVGGEAGLLALFSLLVLWGGAMLAALGDLKSAWECDWVRVQIDLWLIAMLGGMALQEMVEWDVLRVSFMNYLFFFLVSLGWSLKFRLEIPSRPPLKLGLFK